MEISQQQLIRRLQGSNPANRAPVAPKELLTSGFAVRGSLVHLRLRPAVIEARDVLPNISLRPRRARQPSSASEIRRLAASSWPTMHLA